MRMTTATYQSEVFLGSAATNHCVPYNLKEKDLIPDFSLKTDTEASPACIYFGIISSQ